MPLADGGALVGQLAEPSVDAGWNNEFGSARLVLQVCWAFAVQALRAVEPAVTCDPGAEGQLVLLARAGEDGVADVRAYLELGGQRREVMAPVRGHVRVVRLEGGTHLELSVKESLLLAGLFRGDRAVYLRSRLPSDAGLPGGAYDPPRAILRGDVG